MYRNVGALALLILAGCTTTGIDNNPKTREDAMASAKRVSGTATTGLDACMDICYDDDGDTATSMECAAVYGKDLDADGYAGDPVSTTNIFEENSTTGATYVCSFTWPSGFVEITESALIDADCDDAESDNFPGNAEECDGIDNDCDEAIDETGTATVSYPDMDEDGFGDSSAPDWSCVTPVGNITDGTDCDDNPTNGEFTFPGAASEEADRDDAAACMTDADDDGYGDDSPATGVTAGTDCNDGSDVVNEGMEEVCNGFDDNCGGFNNPFGVYTDIDEVYYPGVPSSEVVERLDVIPFYSDADTDGAAGTFVGYACEGTAVDTAYSDVSTDCDDDDAAINPAAAEVCDSGNVDENCSGAAEESGATGESTWYLDSDADTYGLLSSTTLACDLPSGYVASSTDCNDANAAIYPGAAEVCDSGSVDEDCDTLADDADSSATGQSTWYLDSDHDGYSTGTTVRVSCDQPEWTELVNDSDCNDSSATVYPGASETCNTVDDDCDGTVDDGVQTTYYRDADADSYGNSSVTYAACSLPSGYVVNSTDCDDGDILDHPGGTETCNGDDEDCDGVADDGVKSTVYPDSDGDGYGDEDAVSSSACISSTMVIDHTDCNDDDVYVNPAESDPDNDGLDNDCDGEAMDEVCTTLVAAYSGKSYQLWLSDLTVYPYTPSDSGWVAPGYAQGTSVPVCGSFLLVEGNTLKWNAVIDYSGDGTYGNSSDTYGFLYPGTNNFSTMTIMDESVNMANVSAGGDVTQIPWTWGTYTGNDGSVVIPELPN